MRKLRQRIGLGSGMELRVDEDIDALWWDLRNVRETIVPQAAASAMTTVLRRVRKHSLKRLRQITRLPARLFTKRVRVKRPNPRKPDQMWGALYASQYDFNLARIFKEEWVKKGKHKGAMKVGPFMYERAWIRKYFGRDVILHRPHLDSGKVSLGVIDWYDLGTRIIKNNMRRLGRLLFRRTLSEQLQKRLRRRGQHRSATRVARLLR